MLCSEIFGHFREERLNFQQLEVKDCRETVNLIQLMAGPYAEEKTRNDAFNEFLQEFLGSDYAVDKLEAPIKSGGIVRGTNRKAMLANLELKNERGKTGDDAGTQNISYYKDYWNSLLTKGKVKADTPMPTLLIQVVGPSIWCSGALFHHGKLIVDPLCPQLHLLATPHDQQSLLAIAALLRAIRMCLDRLNEYYANNDVEQSTLFCLL